MSWKQCPKYHIIYKLACRQLCRRSVKPIPFCYRDGHMVGKCLASMLTMYWQSRDILLKEESPTLAASVVETNSNNKSNKSTSTVSLEVASAVI